MEVFRRILGMWGKMHGLLLRLSVTCKCLHLTGSPETISVICMKAPVTTVASIGTLVFQIISVTYYRKVASTGTQIFTHQTPSMGLAFSRPLIFILTRGRTSWGSGATFTMPDLQR